MLVVSESYAGALVSPIGHGGGGNDVLCFLPKRADERIVGHRRKRKRSAHPPIQRRIMSTHHHPVLR